MLYIISYGEISEITMAKKISNPSKTKKKSSMDVLTWQEEYDRRLGIRMTPVSDEYLHDLGEEFIKWISTPTLPNERPRISLEGYCEVKGIHYDTLQRWCKRDAYLKNCIKHGMTIIGNRLEEGLISKRFSEKAVLLQIHHYLSRWKSIEKYHDARAKELRRTEDEKPTTVVINMTDYKDAKPKDE